MGAKILGVSPVFFRSMDQKFLLFRRGSFMGQNFLYRANFKIKKKSKRLDFQTLSTGLEYCPGQYSKPVLVFGTERVKEYNNNEFQLICVQALFASKTCGLLTL